MNLEQLQDELSTALQADLEHGVNWLNEWHSKVFAENYPMINEWIGKFMELEDE